MNDIALPINTLAGRGIGDNRPPLAEVLAEEQHIYRERADELLASAKSAQITNETEAGKVADLIALLRAWERTIEKARDERKEPYKTAVRTVDTSYGSIVRPLASARESLSNMLTAWQQENGAIPLTASIAGVGTRREIAFCIDDLPSAIGWLLQNRPGEIAQAARTIIGATLRSIGVGHAAEAAIPGVVVTIQSKTQVR